MFQRMNSGKKIINALKRMQDEKLSASQLETVMKLYNETACDLPQIYRFVHEHFGINKICIVYSHVLQIVPENSENISVITEDELKDLAMGEKSLAVIFHDIPELEDWLLKKEIRLITYTELVYLYKKSCSESPKLPLILNTIENLFEEVYVIGKNKTACKVYEYLSANPSVNVFDVEIEDVINHMVENTSKDAVYLVIDLLPYIIEKYIRMLVIHWRKLGTDEEIMDGRRDIHDIILPKLHGGGGTGHHSCYTSSV